MPDIFLARFVAETEPYDDDLTQMEEERPTKRPCIEGNVFVLLLIIFILLNNVLPGGRPFMLGTTTCGGHQQCQIFSRQIVMLCSCLNGTVASEITGHMRLKN